ncbi:type III secretion system inner rod subunit SctI [Escherichia coli]|uniref:type III secretion system inner rod subunit SctI n=1 Tax=Escherichia coli TaxID=562 RepID=UPI000DA5B69F|nr:type III secretion system inner rod subunit SctI [Escherichia coli]EFC4872283.1 type III secretion system protein PrgJ [Escherichia coli]EGK3604198.1 type III secretion system protein PrgJ [Escherichia coli]EHK4147995.1 type III secretion system inner rod subunit SctI [Escherichia coli]EJJ0330210.1 type III secretion system inner rod subunit SctI [Escherichia coli]EKY5128035.1 type III secretion system inner rod subunit SctI [Escherichia coli]
MNTQQVSSVNIIKSCSQTEERVVSLEERAIEETINSIVEYDARRNHIENLAKSARSPEDYIALQEAISDYSIDVSLAQTLVRKVTSAAENLLRSS